MLPCRAEHVSHAMLEHQTVNRLGNEIGRAGVVRLRDANEIIQPGNDQDGDRGRGAIPSPVPGIAPKPSIRGMTRSTIRSFWYRWWMTILTGLCPVGGFLTRCCGKTNVLQCLDRNQSGNRIVVDDEYCRFRVHHDLSEYPAAAGDKHTCQRGCQHRRERNGLAKPDGVPRPKQENPSAGKPQRDEERGNAAAETHPTRCLR